MLNLNISRDAECTSRIRTQTIRMKSMTTSINIKKNNHHRLEHMVIKLNTF